MKDYFDCDCGETVIVTNYRLDKEKEKWKIIEMSDEARKLYIHNKKCPDCIEKTKVKIWKASVEINDEDDEDKENHFVSYYKDKDHAMAEMMDCLKEYIQNNDDVEKIRLFISLESYVLH